MKQSLILTLLIVTLMSFGTSLYAVSEDRDWKTGKVLDTDSERFTTYGGSTTQGRVDDYGNVTATTNRSTWNHRQEVVAIEGSDYIYVISRVVSFRWTKKARLTVNGFVKYAIDGETIYIIDDEEREHKFKLSKKIFKETKAQNIQKTTPPDGSLSATKQETDRIIANSKTTAPALVNVKSDPAGADIIVDGKFVGSTQSSLRIMPGEHVITIEKAGYKSWLRTMMINDGGGEITVNATLEKLP